MSKNVYKTTRGFAQVDTFALVVGCKSKERLYQCLCLSMSLSKVLTTM